MSNVIQIDFSKKKSGNVKSIKTGLFRAPRQILETLELPFNKKAHIASGITSDKLMEEVSGLVQHYSEWAHENNIAVSNDKVIILHKYVTRMILANKYLEAYMRHGE